MFNLLDLNRVSAVLAASMFLAACGGSGSSGNSGPDSVESLEAAQPLTYYAHAKPIIDTRCVTCHHAGGQGPFPLSDYAAVASKRSAIIYALESKSMPSPGYAPLSGQERELLIDWLEAGAVQGSAAGGPHPTPYTYYGEAKAIIEDKCANCHQPGEIAPFSLTNYQAVYAVRAAVAQQIASRAMPPWKPYMAISSAVGSYSTTLSSSATPTKSPSRPRASSEIAPGPNN